MFRFTAILSICILSLFSCSESTEIKSGSWRAEVSTIAGALPFNLDIQQKGDGYEVHAINGEERLLMDNAYLDEEDSLHIPMEIFDAEIIAKASDDKLNGVFKKKMGDLTVRESNFTATFGENHRFVEKSEKTTFDVSGKYDVEFRYDNESYPAVGVFEQTGNEVTGTFLTTTGDYRYLQGNVVDDSLKLSCFDGTHVFLFKAKIEEDKLVGGVFCASLTYTEEWSAVKNENAVLPEANSLTHLKEGYDSIKFSFKNEKGETVSLTDERYQNKVVAVQILGSWCPNCMDETKFLVPFYEKNKGKGFEVIGLAFEKKTDPDFAYPKIERMKERFNVPYEVLIAGINDKTEAAKSLPMLDHILSFPTLITIDKKGKVREIHTGFSGPGTGAYYDKFVTDYNRLIEKLLSE
jgi:thiol-disulfide isomerase/thioredoxin